MTTFDIVILILLCIAAVGGYRDGALVRACSLAALFLGAWLAFKLGAVVGGWMVDNPKTATIVGFLTVFVVVVILLGLLGRGLHALFHKTGLGFFDHLGGLLIGVVEWALVIGLALSSLSSLVPESKWIGTQALAKTATAEPIIKVADSLFPYLLQAKEMLVDAVENPMNENEVDQQRQKILNI